MPGPRRTPFAPKDPALVLVTDASRLRGRALADVVRPAVDGGVTIVQLRDKSATHPDLLREGRMLREATAGRALFFVNGDVEAALVLGADGVHLPEAGEGIADARARAGQALLISRAVHSVAAAVEAEHAGADLLQAGTLFATPSHPGAPLLGVERLRELCAAVRIPVIAIGGITSANARHALDAGASGVAVIGAIFDAQDPRQAAHELREALSSAHAGAR
ncbi:MAG TPA: thiamine phosphate synthase [Dehalococcoidia bacterium]|jgi:thiamine-phosphate pyrophosphorylase|nr:thiamine phosphate synthase [Dehalococcoidia bacterium]